MLITGKMFSPLKINRLKLSVISEFSNMVYEKKQKPGDAGNQRKALQSKDHPLLTFEIAK